MFVTRFLYSIGVLMLVLSLKDSHKRFYQNNPNMDEVLRSPRRRPQPVLGICSWQLLVPCGSFVA